MPVPHPLAYALADATWSTGLGEAPGGFIDYVRYPLRGRRREGGPRAGLRGALRKPGGAHGLSGLSVPRSAIADAVSAWPMEACDESMKQGAKTERDDEGTRSTRWSGGPAPAVRGPRRSRAIQALERGARGDTQGAGVGATRTDRGGRPAGQPRPAAPRGSAGTHPREPRPAAGRALLRLALRGERRVRPRSRVRGHPPPVLRVPVRRLVAGRGLRHRAHPGLGARAGRVEPLRRAPLRRRHGQAGHPAPPSRAARLPHADPRHVRAAALPRSRPHEARGGPRPSRQRRAPARQAESWWASSPRGSRVWASTSASATSWLASAAAASYAIALRTGAPHHPLRGGGRGGDPPRPRAGRLGGPALRPSLLPHHPHLPVAGAAGARSAARPSGRSTSPTPSPWTATGRRPRRTPSSSTGSPRRSGRRSSG